MFRRSKDGDGGNPADGEAGAEDIQAPPIKPFSKKGSHAPNKPSSTADLRPSVTRPSLEIPGPTRRADRSRAGQSESNKLTVGRDLHLKGEITSCHKLVVEGKVEAALADAHAIEVAPSGYFKGDAQVNEADISGRYEGTLIARDKLIIRAGGRVSGSIRYGRIVIESGGEITGDMQALGPEREVTTDTESAKRDGEADKAAPYASST
ncbi:MAG: polymer-forming cytoskeletal protein [Rhodospirillales bacterium]|jgi:cytoskeletal protein CcmA (bactofilin family)|nr:polymer-forming cytoskeletal protein [Rhodospirillales bacterium]MDP6805559.1 polymer-forming cytoskeletal protein [Rhodospirillales bacterium]